MEEKDCLSQFAGHLSRRNYKRVIIGLSKGPSRDSYLGLKDILYILYIYLFKELGL